MGLLTRLLLCVTVYMKHMRSVAQMRNVPSYWNISSMAEQTGLYIVCMSDSVVIPVLYKCLVLLQKSRTVTKYCYT